MNKKAFAVLAGSMFISMLGMGIVSPFLPIYADTLGASKLEVGLVQSAFNITGIGTLLFIGRLSDRFGRKAFLSGGLAILAISSVGLMFANDIVHDGHAFRQWRRADHAGKHCRLAWTRVCILFGRCLYGGRNRSLCLDGPRIRSQSAPIGR